MIQDTLAVDDGLRTEYQFTLPCGFVDERGDLHRGGVMRLATALDEVEPLRDPRVRGNEAYLSILLLSRVVVELGAISPVSPAVVERLFATDFTYLQNLYERVNQADSGLVETECPTCGTRFALDLAETNGAI
jgi:hypothetical protein